ncbi:unnamed protein product [Rhodiola kirilowii]
MVRGHLTTYINAKGEGNGKALPQKAGLNRDAGRVVDSDGLTT